MRREIRTQLVDTKIVNATGRSQMDKAMAILRQRGYIPEGGIGAVKNAVYGGGGSSNTTFSQTMSLYQDVEVWIRDSEDSAALSQEQRRDQLNQHREQLEKAIQEAKEYVAKTREKQASVSQETGAGIFAKLKKRKLEQRVAKSKELIAQAKANQEEIPQIDTQIKELSEKLDKYYTEHPEITKEILLRSM